MNKEAIVLYSNSPFYTQSVAQINGPGIALIVLGIAFILMGILSFFYYFKYSKNQIKEFKERQMQEYYKDNPKRVNLSYDQTGMYIPAWERVKFNFPLFFGVLIIFIGIAFLAGNSLSTL